MPPTRTTGSRRSKPDLPSQIPAKVLAVASHSKSERNLTWSLYFARCTGCGERRTFTQSGDRVCACGQRLHLVVTAVIS